MKLHIKGEYPADWEAISDRVWADAGHRCIRCRHPYRKGEHGKGEWTPCDEYCTHDGPTRPFLVEGTVTTCAQWRIATVHHFDGDKANCNWWNLLALCQRCHLKTQARVNPHETYVFEHSEWLKPYVAGFYAHKYERVQLNRAQVMERLNELLALERIA